jgi:hypothetical protein
MAELFDKHGGFRRLQSFTLATIIQIETLRFCRRFLTHETRLRQGAVLGVPGLPGLQRNEADRTRRTALT